ncbi:MAG TPA: hypothetical protein VF765_21620 [Polyangiaceae bacterium]
MDPKVTRRDTLRLATAASALGIGLGIGVDAKAAAGASVSLKRTDASALALNFYKWDAKGGYSLLSKMDLTSFVKGDISTAALKLTYMKMGAGDETTLHELKLSIT